MINLSSLSLDLPAIKINTAPKRHTYYAIAMKRKSFYQQHDLAIWLAIVLGVAVSYSLLFVHNANLLWAASGWVMGYLP